MADSHEASAPTYASDEARAARIYAAICLPGRDYVLPLRWVDVMPAVVVDRDLLAEVRAARAMVVEVPSEPVELTPEDEAARERHRRNNRNSWERKKLRLYGGLTREQRAAQREAQKAATRTPEQQQRHEWYTARREEILQRAKEKRAKGVTQ